MSEILRLGLVGCGGISRSLYVNLLAGFAEGARVVAVCDVVADAMIDASRRYNRKLSIQYCTRFFREAEQAKLAIASGKLGRIVLGRMDASWYHTMDSYFAKDAWRGSWAGEGGGSAFHHGRYGSDLFLHLLDDELTEVAALTGRALHLVEVEDVSTASLRFASGALGHATTSPLLRHGTKFILSVGSSDETYAREVRTFLDETIPPRDEDMQVTQMRRFLDAVENDDSVPVSGESARKHVELVRGTYKSAFTHSVVAMPLPPADPFYGPEGTASAAAPL